MPEPLRYPCWCQVCIVAAHPLMLTGYCIWDSPCDRCGRSADLAIVEAHHDPAR